MTAKQVTRALTCSPNAPFYFRRYIVVPNVSWGMGINHECDILALTPAGFAHEIEVKISRADTKRDLQKPHEHDDKKIRCLWFAGPASIVESLVEFAPERSGIIIIDEPNGYFQYGRPQVIRKATPIRGAEKFTDSERMDLCRLGMMRYWSHFEEMETKELRASSEAPHD
jgi:hypothetical protein